MVNIFALAYLYSDDNVLLLHRANVSFGSGNYGLSGGKVEQGETARQAIQREVREELGLDIPLAAFDFVHTFHRKGPDIELVALVFKADISGMQPTNNEPIKHDKITWFNSCQLPENTIPAHKQAIAYIFKNVLYSEHGW